MKTTNLTACSGPLPLGLGCDSSGCGFCLETENVPGNIWPQPLATHTRLALDRGAVFGRHTTTGLPHARCAGGDGEPGSKSLDAPGEGDGLVEGDHGVGRGVNGGVHGLP